MIGGRGSLWWSGEVGKAYFVQRSNDMVSWTYMPVIKSGTGGLMDYSFTSREGLQFFRVKSTDSMGVDPQVDDFDGDGISNWDEVRSGGAGTDPFLRDTDGNDISDGDEDSDADGTNNRLEIRTGSNPHDPNSGGRHDPAVDSDGDGINNSFDAVHTDSLIDWRKTREAQYIWIKIEDVPLDKEGKVQEPRQVNNHGTVLYNQSVWKVGNWHALKCGEDPYYAYASCINDHDQITGWSYSVNNALRTVYWNGLQDSPHQISNGDGSFATSEGWEHGSFGPFYASPGMFLNNAGQFLSSVGSSDPKGYHGIGIWRVGSSNYQQIAGANNLDYVFITENGLVWGVSLSSEAAKVPGYADVPGIGTSLVTLPNGRYGMAAHNGLFLMDLQNDWKKSDGATGGWMKEINALGEAIGSRHSDSWEQSLWRNGKWTQLEDLSTGLKKESYAEYYAIDLTDSGTILIEATKDDGTKEHGILLPVEFEEFEPNAGFDDYERFDAENKLERPWLMIPETNKVIMERKPADVKLELSVNYPEGKNGSVNPAESSQSPETLTLTGTGPWGGEEYGHEGTLKVNGAEALNLAVYKKRTLTVAVHSITLINDDEDVGGAWKGVGDPHTVMVEPGPNGVLDTAVNGSGHSGASDDFPNDDDLVVGQTITNGANGIRDTFKVKAKSVPKNVPSKKLLEAELNRIFGKQANIYFEVISYNSVEVAYDVPDPEFPGHLDNPNWTFDFYLDKKLSPEEMLVRNASINQGANIDLYFLPTGISWWRDKGKPVGVIGASPFAMAVDVEREGVKVAYISAWNVEHSAEYLAGVAAHEIGHHKLFDGSVGLDHPWQLDLKTKHYERSGKEDYPLQNITDDRKRLMFPYSQENTDDFPCLLLKEECDKLRGVWKGVGQ